MKLLRLQVIEWWTNFDSFITREDINGVETLQNKPAYLNGTELYSQLMLDRKLVGVRKLRLHLWPSAQQRSTISRIPPTQGTLGLRWDTTNRLSYFDVYTWLVDRADRYNQFNLSDVRFIRGDPGIRNSQSPDRP